MKLHLLFLNLKGSLSLYVTVCKMLIILGVKCLAHLVYLSSKGEHSSIKKDKFSVNLNPSPIPPPRQVVTMSIGMMTSSYSFSWLAESVSSSVSHES